MEMTEQAGFRLFCSHGATLFYIARHPGCTIRELTDAFVVTQRTMWGLISDLKRADLLDIRKEGRRHHYTIKDDAPFPDPLFAHATLGQVFRALCAACEGSDQDLAAFATAAPTTSPAPRATRSA